MKKKLTGNCLFDTDVFIFLSKISGVGSNIPADNTICTQLRQFTLKVIYSDNVNTTLAKSRAARWSKMKKKCTRRLPPDENSHELRALRVNYICHILLNYQNKEAPPSPFSNDWIRTDGNFLFLFHFFSNQRFLIFRTFIVT